jgi:hypothetical protein
VGRSIAIIIPPERLDEEERALARIRTGQRVEPFETVRRRKDGTHIDVSVTISPVKSSDGVVVGASKIARDISERRREERLRARWPWSRARYRASPDRVARRDDRSAERGRGSRRDIRRAAAVVHARLRTLSVCAAEFSCRTRRDRPRTRAR